MITIQSSDTVGQVAKEHPLATRVFHRHGIDFCCGGGKPLDEACAKRGVDITAILDEIHRELETATEPEQRWDQAPLDQLIDHIVGTYHDALREELPRLEGMASKVLKVHFDTDPARLTQLHTVFSNLKDELEQHMLKEEQILFPMIRNGKGAMAVGPVSVMEDEHTSASEALESLRQLTNDYEVPEYACTTWRALWHGLAALEESLHQHIHLENNILFPRALAS